MSYKCEKCKKQIKQGITQFKIFKIRKINIIDGFITQIISESKVCPVCWVGGSE